MYAIIWEHVYLPILGILVVFLHYQGYLESIYRGNICVHCRKFGYFTPLSMILFEVQAIMELFVVIIKAIDNFFKFFICSI